MTKEALQAIWEKEKRDRYALEAVMTKIIKVPAAAQGLLGLFGGMRRVAAKDGSTENRFVLWALRVSMEILRTGIGMDMGVGGANI
jgi:hypothetical protein